jgi:serine/threonine protein kinase
VISSDSGPQSEDYGTFAGFSGVQAAALRESSDAVPARSAFEAVQFARESLARDSESNADEVEQSRFQAARLIKALSKLRAIFTLKKNPWLRGVPKDIESAGTPPPYPSGDFRLVHNFEQSGEGAVQVAKQRLTGKLVAVKTIKLGQDAAERPEIPDEIKSFSLVQRHPNIVRALAYYVHNELGGDFGKIVMPYCDGGDLHSFVRHWERLLESGSHATVPPIFALHVIASLSDALNYLHEAQGGRTGIRRFFRFDALIHGDLKPANILLNWPHCRTQFGLPNVILGDLGMVGLEKDSTGVCGTRSFLPPEASSVLALRYSNPVAYDFAGNQKILSRASDIYCFGAVAYSVSAGRMFNNERYTYTPAGVAEEFAGHPLTAFKHVMKILTSSLAEKPEDRITTGALASMTPSLKRDIARLYRSGERMPADSWPAIVFSTKPVNPPPEDSSSSITRRYFEIAIALTTAAPPAYDSTNENADKMSQISGFSEVFCNCPNHRPLSELKPKPGCDPKFQRRAGEANDKRNGIESAHDSGVHADADAIAGPSQAPRRQPSSMQVHIHGDFALMDDDPYAVSEEF